MFEIADNIHLEVGLHITLLKWQTRYGIAHIALADGSVAAIPQIAEEIALKAVAHVAWNTSVVA